MFFEMMQQRWYRHGSEFQIAASIFMGSAWTDQGLIQGEAYQTLLYRKQVGTQVSIAADVLVKHASPAIKPS